MSEPIRILYVDDYALDRELVRDALEREVGGFQVTEAASRSEFEARLDARDFDLVLTDFNILGTEGLEIVDIVRARNPGLPVVVVTGTGSEEIAVAAMKRGADDYVIKTSSHVQRLPAAIMAAVNRRHERNERLLADEELRRARERLEHLVSNSPAVIYGFRADGDCAPTYVSDNVTAQTGHEPHEFLGDPGFWARHVHPEDRRNLRRDLRELIRRGSHSREYRFLCKDGSYRWTRDDMRLVRGAAGKPAEVIGSLVDITELKSAEDGLRTAAVQQATVAELGQRAMRSSGLDVLIDETVKLVARALRAQYCTVVEVLPEGTAGTAYGGGAGGLGWQSRMQIQPDGMIAYVLRQVQPIVVRDLPSETRFVPPANTVALGVTDSIAVSIRGRDRPIGVLSVHDATRGRSFTEEDGHFVQAIANALAVAIEHQRGEEQLLRAERLELAGRIAGQVAHDFGNLLVPLAGYPEVIKKQFPGDEEVAGYCDAMLRSVKQMTYIAEELLTLGRRAAPRLEPTDLTRVVQAALEKLGPRLGSLRPDLDLARDLPAVNGSPAQLLRVAFNLLSNACDAMDGAGTLSVKTESVQVDQPVGRYDRVEPGRYVRLSVGDTGHGIPQQIRDRIFEAYFTTKKADEKRGSGLGLAIVQAIVADHRGYVDLDSDVGKGSTFSVYIPIAQDKPSS